MYDTKQKRFCCSRKYLLETVLSQQNVNSLAVAVDLSNFIEHISSFKDFNLSLYFKDLVLNSLLNTLKNWFGYQKFKNQYTYFLLNNK